MRTDILNQNPLIEIRTTHEYRRSRHTGGSGAASGGVDV